MTTPSAALGAVLAALRGVLRRPGCGGDTRPTGGYRSITVFAAASLTEAFTTLGASSSRTAHPGTTVELSFGASSDLATQIGKGAPVDVFASAVHDEHGHGASGGPARRARSDFARNTMEIAVPPGNPAHITSRRRPGRRWRQGRRSATRRCRAGRGRAAGLRQRRRHRAPGHRSEADVKSTLAKVEIGEVDAGVVYVTDVRAAGDQVNGDRDPAAQRLHDLPDRRR